MNTDPNDPGKKMRKLLGNSNPLTRLPKKNGNDNSFIKENDRADAPQEQQSAIPADPPPKNKPASATKQKADSGSRGSNFIFGPPLWNVASILSLTINVILIIVLLILAMSINSLGLSISSLLNMGTDLLGGLYGNFEKMDRAHITTNIDVATTIPVKFDLQLNQQTNVVLSQDVTITNALVTVNTGGLNISRANTTIVLPSGTTLPVFLNLTVPVDTTVPVSLNVPVDIPLDQTQLHEPFTGLQEVVRPFYCMINANAVNLNGEPICK
ncbi:MAG: hypothetical protein JNM02_11655 [Anaerolineales bacterium]|nr:hypothetical protein [Anaerolineales bacterium]